MTDDIYKFIKELGKSRPFLPMEGVSGKMDQNMDKFIYKVRLKRPDRVRVILEYDLPGDTTELVFDSLPGKDFTNTEWIARFPHKALTSETGYKLEFCIAEVLEVIRPNEKDGT